MFCYQTRQIHYVGKWQNSRLRRTSSKISSISGQHQTFINRGILLNDGTPYNPNSGIVTVPGTYLLAASAEHYFKGYG